MFSSLIKALADTKLLKVTGSFADGTQNLNSDIDFKVKEDHPDTPFRERNMLKIIEVLQQFSVKWHSTECGYISTIGEFNPELERELEFAEMFRKRPNKLKEVVIEGVTFKTY